MKRFYERHILPHLVHRACGAQTVAEQRAKVVPGAVGCVLEIGFGSGLNLPYYDPGRVDHVWALEPSQEMWSLAEPLVERSTVPVEYVPARAEEIPLENRSVDTVLITYSLCTIPDVTAALGEIRRVLRVDGRLLFCEHGASSDERILRWQNRLNPIWSRIAGGCQLNRRVDDLLKQNRFEITSLTAEYSEGWKVDSFHYLGEAVPYR